ncbi:MAG: UDP-N-acetylmuramoyl-tripeptide--D-alanyl-D-alanine ligase [Patescibacteria group bacterium]|nr:UDP-N-acetylmuramoyl-tripeptide--D-alanyl-D-alanine ligase [Patescibacteria group bacterium]
MRKVFERYLGWCTKRAILRDKPAVIVIGGSVGKSSTRSAISLTLSAIFKPEEYRTSLKNYNNELGVPLSVFAKEMPGRSVGKWLDLLVTATLHLLGFKKLTMRYLVLEMGADHPGDIDYLLNIASPKVAIITALGAEHVEYFGTVENAVEEERKILRALPEDGEAILNIDDEYSWSSRDLVKGESVGFGKGAEALAKIESTQIIYNQENFAESGLEVNFKIMGYHEFTVLLKGVFGEPNAYAVAAALAFCLGMDYDLKPVIDKLDNGFIGMPGRTRLIEGIKKTVLLDDTYNAQPQAMTSAIKDLQKFPVPEGGRRIAVLGDMLELGNMAMHEHELIGELAAKSNIDILICCGTLGRVIAEKAIINGMDESRVRMFEKSEEAGYYLQQEVIRPGDAILVKGSQGVRMEKIVKELMAEPLRAEELIVRQSAEWLAKIR